MDGGKGRIDGMTDRRMDRWIDGQLDSKMSPKIMLPFCHPISICFLVSPAPWLVLTCFNRGKFYISSLKGNHMSTTCQPQNPECPPYGSSLPKHNTRMSVGKGVPQTHKHAGNLVLLNNRSWAPSLSTQVPHHHRPIKHHSLRTASFVSEDPWHSLTRPACGRPENEASLSATFIPVFNFYLIRQVKRST